MTLFEALNSLKLKGYDYVSSQNNDSYVGYDQAVTDFYEGLGNHEPTYLDWLTESVAPNFKVDKFTFYYNSILYYGTISEGDINSDINIDNICGNSEIKSRTDIMNKLIGAEIDYSEIYAMAIWSFNLEKEDYRIKNIEKFIQSSFWGQNRIDIVFSFILVDSTCWANPEFVLGIVKFIKGYYSPASLEYVSICIDPSLKTPEFMDEIFKINPKMTEYLRS